MFFAENRDCTDWFRMDDTRQTFVSRRCSTAPSLKESSHRLQKISVAMASTVKSSEKMPVPPLLLSVDKNLASLEASAVTLQNKIDVVEFQTRAFSTSALRKTFTR